MSNNILEPFQYNFENKKYNNFQQFISLNEKNLTIDNASIYSLINKGYILGDNTLIKNLQKDSWAKEIKLDLEHYNTLYKSTKVIAEDLINLLNEEISNSIFNKENIYILLSGGMDSRILAALLKKMQSNKELEYKKIHAITWGISNSRDVHYAKMICDKFGWEWHHLPLSSEILYENIDIVINLLGAEVSPIHLHRYLEAGNIASDPKSIILAATYGDSLGRGEYSGVKVKNLTEMTISDRFSIFKTHYKKELIQENNDRLEEFRQRFEGFENAIPELEQQNHYLYKMLYNASTIVNYHSEIYQLFSSEKVINYILSLKFDCRNNSVYNEMLKILNPDLLKVSWARTGKQYLGKSAKRDNLHKNHHNYQSWIKENFSKDIKEAINSDTIKNLGIFDVTQLNRLYFLWRLEKKSRVSSLNEKFMTILSIKIMIEKFGVTNNVNDNSILEGRFDKEKIKGLITEGLIVIKGYLK